MFIIWQGGFEVNMSVVIGSYLVCILLDGWSKLLGPQCSPCAQLVWGISDSCDFPFLS